MGLSTKAMLVNISISGEGIFECQDARMQNAAAKEFKTDSAVIFAKKHLLPDAAEFRSVRTAAGRLRKYFKYITLPWLSDGTRIISSVGYLEFTAEFRRLRNEFDSAVSAFCTAYPALQAQAEQRLGDLYRPSDYPAPADIKNQFNVTLTIMPLPDVTDFRTNVSDSEKAEFIETIKSVETKATQECFERLHVVISKAIQTLSNPDAKFKDSLFENIKECCELLPKLNVTESPELDQAVQSTNQALANVSADVCRDNSKERQSAADALKAIESLMSHAMGRKPDGAQ